MAYVSVIVPVYNVENYLEKCVQSILSQSLKEIEIILIDDGSTDNSGKICDKFSSIDKRIKVIHQQNEGLSAARNKGILVASAPYIMFVDSDDWVEPDFCKRPYEIAVCNSVDIVLFMCRYVHRDGTTRITRSNMKEGLLTKDEAMFFNVCVAHNVVIALYKRTLFEDILFPNGRLYEDIGTTHEIIYKANTFYLLNSVLYNYFRGRSDSITTYADTTRHHDRREMLVKRINDLQQWGYDEYVFIYSFRQLIRYGCKDEEQKRFIEIAESRKTSLPKSLRWKQKLLYYAFKVSHGLFDFLCVVTRERLR